MSRIRPFRRWSGMSLLAIFARYRANIGSKRPPPRVYLGSELDKMNNLLVDGQQIWLPVTPTALYERFSKGSSVSGNHFGIVVQARY